MNKKLPPPKKQWYLLLWPFLLLSSLLIILWSPSGLLHLRQLQREYQELRQKNRALEKENYRLYEEIDRLLNDPKAVEQLARQELGLVKDGELIFLFPQPPLEGRP